MRTTMRVTWALVSIGVLLHCGCSDGSGTGPSADPNASPGGNTTTTVTIIVTTNQQVPAAATTKATHPPASPQAAITIAQTTDKPTATSDPKAPIQAPTQAPNPHNTTTTAPTETTKATGSPGLGAPTGAKNSTPDATTSQPVNSPSPAPTVSSSMGTTAKPSTASLSPANVQTQAPGGPDTTTPPAPAETSSRAVREAMTTITAVETSSKGTTSKVMQSPKVTVPTTSENTAKGDTVTVSTTVSSRVTSEIATTSVPTTTNPSAAITTEAPPKQFTFSYRKGDEDHTNKDLVEVCKRLMADMHEANCTLSVRQHNNKTEFESVEMFGKVSAKLANQYYEEITKKSGDNTTLIAILASCGALLAMIIGLAIYASHHRKPYSENQQHLTEELHTVENGYHDNPTLEVMEVQPEMQEKKVALNGEFNDSWIVPIDNLLKDDVPDEEDTHL